MASTYPELVNSQAASLHVDRVWVLEGREDLLAATLKLVIGFAPWEARARSRHRGPVGLASKARPTPLLRTDKFRRTSIRCQRPEVDERRQRDKVGVGAPVRPGLAGALSMGPAIMKMAA